MRLTMAQPTTLASEPTEDTERKRMYLRASVLSVSMLAAPIA